MNTSKAEAERLLEIGEELLQKRDLKGSREIAILVQETEPLLEGSDQILAIVDVLEAAEKPLNLNNHHLDWYAILQINRNSQDLNLIKKQYRTLALLLHPDKNPFSFSELAFKLVSDAWAVLSDPAQKAQYDKGFEFELEGTNNGLGNGNGNKCDKSFHGVSIRSLPPIVPGQEAYEVSWGMFPMGFVFESLGNGGGDVVVGSGTRKS
ncbi:cysteine string protein [Trifolium pratense]|uniref:Cysteine string protein n=1 Tax=Trifolium pratense TaxID=57577 RepID=A0A2K3P6J0_TRIPR|nr:cysteine string protein [Trifolium pratense]PNY10905.1 cysteine string protein [Trifolium pratense]